MNNYTSIGQCFDRCVFHLKYNVSQMCYRKWCAQRHSKHYEIVEDHKKTAAAALAERNAARSAAATQGQAAATCGKFVAENVFRPEPCQGQGSSQGQGPSQGQGQGGSQNQPLDLSTGQTGVAVVMLIFQG